MKPLLTLLAAMLVCCNAKSQNKISLKNGQEWDVKISRLGKTTLGFHAAGADAPLIEIPVDEIDRVSIAKRNPGAAFFLSFLIPGGGQIYNKQGGKGILMTIIGLGGVGIYIAGTNDTTPSKGFTTNYFGNGGNARVPSSEQDPNYKLMRLGFTLAIGGYLWSMIDAPIMSNKINDWYNLSPSLSAEPISGGLGFNSSIGPKLTLKF